MVACRWVVTLVVGAPPCWPQWWALRGARAQEAARKVWEGGGKLGLL